MSNCYKYSISIHYRAGECSEREKMLLECAKEYACDVGPHLIDRLLEDRYKIFEAHRAELASIAADEAQLAERKRKVMGG